MSVRVPVVAGLAGLGLLAAGCGGSKAPSVARIGQTTTTSAPRSSSATQSEVLYASCMRAHGVSSFPDPLPGGGFDVPKGLKREPQFQPAFQACQGDLPSAIPRAKHVDLQEELDFSRCMRSHGIADFPDPRSTGGWNYSLAESSSPRFAAAARACRTTGIHWNAPP